MVKKDSNPEREPTTVSPKTYNGLVRTIGRLTRGRGSKIYTVDDLLTDKSPAIRLPGSEDDRRAGVLQGSAGRMFEVGSRADEEKEVVRVIKYNNVGKAIINPESPRINPIGAEIHLLKTYERAKLTSDIVLFERGLAVAEGVCRLTDPVDDVSSSAEVKQFAERWGVGEQWNRYASGPLVGMQGLFQEVVNENMGRKIQIALDELPKLPR